MSGNVLQHGLQPGAAGPTDAASSDDREDFREPKMMGARDRERAVPGLFAAAAVLLRGQPLGAPQGPSTQNAEKIAGRQTVAARVNFLAFRVPAKGLAACTPRSRRRPRVQQQLHPSTTQGKEHHMTKTSKLPSHRVYAVTKNDERSFWREIGAAWTHADGEGFNLKLDYLPLNDAEIVIREIRADEAEAASEKAA
jgi:hypothetical protein